MSSKALLVAQKFWAKTKRSRRLLPQTPTANDALAHAFVSRLPQGPANPINHSGIVMSAVAGAYGGGNYPHALQSCLTISRMPHATLSSVTQANRRQYGQRQLLPSARYELYLKL